MRPEVCTHASAESVVDPRAHPQFGTSLQEVHAPFNSRSLVSTTVLPRDAPAAIDSLTWLSRDEGVEDDGRLLETRSPRIHASGRNGRRSILDGFIAGACR